MQIVFEAAVNVRDDIAVPEINLMIEVVPHDDTAKKESVSYGPLKVDKCIICT